MWIGWLLAVAGVALILYPGFHKSAEGFTTSCGPAVFVIFPGDPGSASLAEQVSMDACWRQGAILLLGGAGITATGVWLTRRGKRAAARVPPRPDVV